MKYGLMKYGLMKYGLIKYGLMKFGVFLNPYVWARALQDNRCFIWFNFH